MNICVYGASSALLNREYYAAGEALGRAMARRGHTLVFGAGNSGMMGAAARGIKSQGGRMIGISPAFFHADGVLCDNCDELILTDTMRERKQLLEERSDAFIASAGGVGTYEELFEVLTLRSLGQLAKPIALYNTRGCYEPLLAMLRQGVKEQFLTQGVLELLFVSDDPEEILDYCEHFVPEHHDINYYKAIEEETP